MFSFTIYMTCPATGQRLYWDCPDLEIAQLVWDELTAEGFLGDPRP